MEGGPVNETMRHRTLNHHVYERLRQLVESGALLPGARLDERALADEMGVSRTPLREAIGKLVEDGLVEHRAYRGNFVRTLTVKQVNDLYLVRAALEGLAVRLAVPRLSEDHVLTVRRVLDDTFAALERGDMAAYSSADQAFHDTLARLSENEPLIAALGRLRRQIQLVRVLANRDPEVVKRTAFERPQILAALEVRDAARAAQLMEEHIDGVRRAVITQLVEAREARDPRDGDVA